MIPFHGTFTRTLVNEGRIIIIECAKMQVSITYFDHQSHYAYMQITSCILSLYITQWAKTTKNVSFFIKVNKAS